MAIDAKLDEEWARNQTASAVFELRALMQKSYGELLTMQTRVNEIVARAAFGDVDAEIVTEGQAVRTSFNDAITDLGDHLEFLNWTQP